MIHNIRYKTSVIPYNTVTLKLSDFMKVVMTKLNKENSN